MREMLVLFNRPESGYVRRWGTLTLCLVAPLLLLASCNRDPGPQDDIGKQVEQTEQRTSVGPENGVSFLELSQNSEEYYGGQVIVSATVSRTFGSQGISLITEEKPENQEPVEDESVLAIGKEGIISGISKGEGVQVTGEARRFNISEFENDLDVNLDNGAYASYEDRPAILIESISPLGETTG